MKKHLSILTAGALALGATSHAAAEDLGAGISVSSSFALTSNYLFRGVTLSDEEPAALGSFDFAHESGAYVGLYGASESPNADTNPELGVYFGYEFMLTDSWWGDVGYYLYHYPAADEDPDTNEVYFGVGSDFGFAEGDLYVHVSDDYFDSDETSVYVETNWVAPIAAGFYGMVHLGYLDIDVDDEEGYDWGIGAGYEYGTLDLNVMVVDQEEASDTQVAVTLSRAF